MPHAASSGPNLGCRVQIGDCRATVKYVGEVKSQTGVWIGLEWDDAARGKHDGSTGGCRYFQCRQSGAGSFMRQEKFTNQAAFGQNVLESLKERYGDQSQGEQPKEVAPEAVTRSGKRKGVEWQLVGADKVHAKLSELGALEKASLISSQVCAVGDSTELARVAAGLQELDLTDNLLANWSVLSELATGLPQLRCLNLSCNAMALPDRMPSPNTALQILVLNSCCLTWAEIVQLQQYVPNLRELHLCNNDLRHLQHPAGQLLFSSLQLLDLENNQIADWKQVMELSSLLSLQHLWLGGNHLKCISLPAGFAGFKKLQTLLLRDNQLSTWADVDSLNRLPNLADLRLTGNPILNDARGGGRFEVIARVQGLTMLNASAVRERERRDCELRYLRAVLGELIEADDAQKAELKALHPRLGALEAQYGPMAGAVAPRPTAASLASSMLEVHLVCVAPSAGKKMGQQTKKIPGSLTVGKLKMLCERLFKVPAGRQALFLNAGGENPMPDNIGQDDARELLFFSIEAGAEILIDDFDPEVQAQQTLRQKAADAERHAARMLQQKKAIEVTQSVQQQQHAETLANLKR